jgi:hypothetical protein
MRAFSLFLSLFVLLAAPARAGVEGSVGVLGVASLATDSPLSSPGIARDGPHLGYSGDLRVGWSLGGQRAFGLGVRAAAFPAAAFPDGDLHLIPHLYYRETVATSGDLRGACFQLLLGAAPEGSCEGDVCSVHEVAYTALGFGIPLDLGFGALLATFDVGFRLSTTPGLFGGPRLMPGVGLAYVFPR